MADPRRVAIVTGCGKPSGIGAVTARRLSCQGVTVVVADVEPKGRANAVEPRTDTAGASGLDMLVQEITAEGGEALAVLGDVSSEEDTMAMVGQAIQHFGRVDVLVNNAGAPHGAEFGDIESVPTDAWDSVLAVNLRGSFLMTRAVVGAMRASGWGRIVNVSSLAGRMGLAQQAAYSASKAGLLGLTRSVAADVAAQGITVNAVCPGLIRTSRAVSSTLRSSSAAVDVDAELDRRGAGVPVGRLGTPEDVAALICFLSSEEAAFITGQSYGIDGGVLMA